jgi:transcriptional regulator with XRE-family HTH domain
MPKSTRPSGARQDRPPGLRLAAEIRRLRRRRGWSQPQLAERAGVSGNHIGLIERGRRSPSLAVALRLAAALDTTLAHLLTPRRREAWADLALRALRKIAPGARRVVLAMLKGAAKTGRSR